MAELEIDGISKAFRTGKVLDGATLALGKGEIVAVFGPSGAGKTVLLRVVAGLHEPDGGAIRIGGEDVTGAGPESRGIGMAFQNFALFPHMTAFENIASALTARRTPADVVRARVDAVAGLLKIGHVMGHQPRELSNGQKQRTALARALVGEPRILLLDDPLRNVDAKLRYEMRLELPALLRRADATVLYVTQDYKEAMALGDRIAVLLDGRFVQVATPAEIYARPATIGVARLFGDPTINLIDVTPAARAGGVDAMVAGAVVSLPAGLARVAGRACVLGIRPESISLARTPGPDRIPVEIMAETPLNEKTVLLLRTTDGLELLASVPGDAGAADVRRRGSVFAALDPASVLLFERDGGQRIASAPHREAIDA